MRYLYLFVGVVLLGFVFALGCSRGGGRGYGLAPAADPCAPSAAAGMACAAGRACGAGAADYDVEIAQAASIAPRVATTSAWMGVAPVPSREDPAPPATTWKRSALAPNTSKLSVGDEDDLPLEAMAVSARIDGFRARVVLDLFYRNTKERQLEGTFRLRLPGGASPHYVAFGQTKLEKPAFTGRVATTITDIQAQRAETWEAMKEARMVPREKAANAYTETVRQQIDPALLEWSGAGVFSARVFPLEPGKLHRIVVGYDVDLVPVGDDLLYQLDLPQVPALEVDLSVNGGDAVVSPEAALREGRYHWRNPEARTLLARIRSPGALLLAAEDPGTGKHFAAQFRPEVPTAEGQAADRAVFLVDTSLSANPDQLNVWLALLQAVLEKSRPQLREFAVAFFDVDTAWWREGFQANTPANVAAVLAHANALTLEGATDLGQAFEAARRLGGAYDLFLLSDGAPTWGEDDLHALARTLGTEHALFAYATGLQGTDPRVLAHLARASGGAVFSVTGANAVQAAATAHRNRPWRLKGVEIAGGSDLLLAGRPTTLFPGQILRLTGRGHPQPGAPIRLVVEQDGVNRTIETSLSSPLDSPLALRVYGEIAVGQIEDLGEARDVARAYATHFRVVGRTCSLLMLESEAEYERYDIRPDEDALLVTKQPAARVVADTLRAIGSALGDPKRRLLAWLARLESSDGPGIKLPDAVKLGLREMPVASFHVVPDALRTKARRTQDVPAGLRAALADRSFSYDAIAAEAERRRAHFGAADGLRALSSLVEHQPGDLELARDVAFTAMAWDLGGQAYGLLRRVVEKRPWQAPTYHALARCLDDMGRTDLALAFYEFALAADVNPGRYGDFRLIVSFDYLRFLRQIERGERKTSVPDLARVRLATVAKGPKVKTADLVMVMAWNTDNTDVDLHVTDPRDEECYYQHQDTKIGGHLTSDVTGGFGPEMFVLKNAVPGDYVAEANYFAGNTTRTGARSKVHMTLYTDWGRPNERVTRKTVVLSKTGERHRLALVRR